MITIDIASKLAKTRRCAL